MGNYHVPFWRAVEGVTPSLTLIIAAIGAVVNQPGGSNGLYCSLSTDSSGLLKAYTVPVIGSV
jgi:hypothetical protein